MSHIGYLRHQRTTDRPYRSGFCTRSNPVGSHDRCPKVFADGRVCDCSCHLFTDDDTTEPEAPVAPPAPGSDEWVRKVTASKVAAILGVSPYESQRSIWHKMRGGVPREESTKAQSRGHYLEPAILAWWRDQHPEYESFTEHPTYTLGDWAAATPDAVAETWPDVAPVLIEAKSAARMDEWGDPGTDVIPAYYLTQVYWQLHLSGASRCYVPVIGPWLEFSEYVVDANPEFGADLEARMRAFYDSLAGDTPPDLDDTTATYDVIRRLHPDIDAELAVELSPADAREYIEAANAAKAAKARETGAKSLVLDRMGKARFAVCGGVKVARRQPGKFGVQLSQVAKTADTLPEDAKTTDTLPEETSTE